MAVILSSSVFAGQNVTLAWDPNSEVDLAGYKVYYGAASGAYTNSISVGKVATATVTNLTVGVAYFFAVTATNTSGLESDRSNEVGYTVPIPNQAPVGVDDVIGANMNTTTRFTPASFLRNDFDLDGDSITLAAVSTESVQHGTVQFAEGLIFYTPPANFSGLDYFTYHIADGKGAFGQATVQINVQQTVKQVRNPSSIKVLTDGTISVEFQGFPGMSFVVQASTDLSLWTALGSTIAGYDGVVQFIDTQASQYPNRYYRLTIP